MKLFPRHVLDFKSAAEKKIFGFLKEINFGPADAALHSLNIGLHEYKRWGEADFVLVTERGLLVLEVKGGRVACKDGIWEFTNRFGNINTKTESPAAQASSAFFSLEKKYLKPSFGSQISRVAAGFGVVFCDVPRFVNGAVSRLPEHPDQITAYESDCRGHNVFRDYLDRAFDHWAPRKGQSGELAPNQIEQIVMALRPSFERLPPLNNQLKDFSRDMCQFTDEQYERMDEIAENDRILVAGGAGTGKTFLAAACARYESSDQQTEVLLVTRSPYLASFLRSHDFPSNVAVTTLEGLGELFSRHGPWDTLIVDEGQDFCDTASLDLLDRALKDGLQKGRWRWFGDPNHQVSPSYPIDPDCYDYLKSLGFKRSLKQNVRNAGRVVEAIGLYSNADVGTPRGNPKTGRVSLVEANTPEEILSSVESTLKGWLMGDGGASRSDIVVLVDEGTNPKTISNELSKRGFRAEALSERALGKVARDCVLVATIEEFKGLERPLACIAGLEGLSEALAGKAYKAISRANHELVLIARGPVLQTLASHAAACAALKKGVRNART